MPQPAKHISHWIGGKPWAGGPPASRGELYNPATGRVSGTVDFASATEVGAAVDAAAAAFPGWRDSSLMKRAGVLFSFRELLRAHAAEIAALISAEHGKVASDAAGEVARGLEVVEFACGLPHLLKGGFSENVSTGVDAYSIRQPLGVVAGITPFNFPAMVPMWMFPLAIGCGNSFVLKPSEKDPSASLLLAELLAEAGLPDGVVNVVTGFGETTGAALAAHPDVDKVAFTGSTDVGKLIVHAAAGNLKKVSLELGGKSPNIVFEDAADSAIEGSANAIFFNHGQCCVAGSRLFVHQNRFDEVVGGVAEIAKAIKLGSGLEASTQMGPMVSEEQFKRVNSFLESGKAEGATALAGGGTFGDRGFFIEPTVLINTHGNMKVVKEEIFGPVVVAEPFSDLDEIAAKANDTPFGLGAGIWTRDISKAHALAKKLRAGSVYVNCYNVFDAALPFGGYKQSGWGREMGHEVLNNYTEVKAVTTLL